MRSPRAAEGAFLICIKLYNFYAVNESRNISDIF